MSLTDIKIKSLKPKDKPYKVFDGDGLYIYVTVKGVKKWRIKYYYNGKDSIYTVGDYPAVSLRDARSRLLEVKEMLAQGKNPAVEKKKHTPVSGGTFREIAAEWADKQTNKWSEEHKQTILYRLERYIYAHLGAFRISEITAPQVLFILRKLEEQGKKRYYQTFAQHNVAGVSLRGCLRVLRV